MKQLLTTGIILTRTDYGEADRILTLLTPDHGKLRLLARGVRKVKSKLAGGIELFSISHITYIPGRGELGTLISTRLQKHYGNIVRDIVRVQTGYDLIKRLHKITEDAPEPAYFELLERSFAALDDLAISPELIRAWFEAQLLRLGGIMPNLRTDTEGRALQAAERYDFSYDDSAFVPRPQGSFGTDDIKFLRLLFSDNPPPVLAKVRGAAELMLRVQPLVSTLGQQYSQ